jgi:phosphoglycerol transferase MdoB-like AlkP superfamily enzyme
MLITEKFFSNCVAVGVIVFIVVLVLVDGANLSHLVIKVNIFFQLIAFSLIPSGFQGAVFPCKNVKNQSELQF